MAARATRIVCIGGGTGQSQVLRGLHAPGRELTAIVGVTDNGGHSGRLRKGFGIPQVGDIRNCLAALAPAESLLAELLKFRFEDGGLEGTSLGNLLVVALMKSRGSLSAAIAALQEELGVAARILPVSNCDAQVSALLEDGRRVTGEWEIIQRRPFSPIARISHEPEVDCHPQAAAALRAADLLVLCPGTLQTGIVSVLVTRGIREAVAASRARVVAICNIMTQPGNTDGFTAADHLALLTRYLGRAPDAFILNTRVPPAAWLDLYAADGAQPVIADVAATATTRVLAADLLEPEGKDVVTLYARAGKGIKAGPHFIRHDPARTAALLETLL